MRAIGHKKPSRIPRLINRSRSTNSSVNGHAAAVPHLMGQLSGASQITKPAIILNKNRPKNLTGGTQTLLDNRQFLIQSLAGRQKFFDIITYNTPQQWRNSIANPAWYQSPIGFDFMNPGYSTDLGATTGLYSKLYDGTPVANDRYCLLHANVDLFMTNVCNNNIYVKVMFCKVRRDQASHPVDLIDQGVAALGYTATGETDPAAGSTTGTAGYMSSDDLNIDATDSNAFKNAFTIIRSYAFDMNAGAEIKINQKIVFNFLAKSEEVKAKADEGSYYIKGGLHCFIKIYGGLVVDQTVGDKPTIGSATLAVVNSCRWVFRPLEQTGPAKTKTLLGLNSISSLATSANQFVDAEDNAFKDAT